MANTSAETIGANVRAEMARQKVTQVQLSGQIGMSQPSLSARLRGLVPFNTTELLAVAQILGVRACDLLGDDKPVVAS